MDFTQKELDWRAIAIWLADCHAATAEYDGKLKSCSKSRRKRFKNICKQAAQMLLLSVPVGIRVASIEDVIRRCQEQGEKNG